MLLHCISTCIICDGEPIVIFMYTTPLCIACLLAPYCFLFAIVSEKFDSDVTWCGFLYIPCVWDSVCFLDLWVYSFNSSWKIYGHYFFNYTSSKLFELFLSSLIPLYFVFVFLLLF